MCVWVRERERRQSFFLFSTQKNEGKQVTFWQIHYQITFSLYTLYACKISRRLKINNYLIYKMFKFQVFDILQLYIKHEFMGLNSKKDPINIEFSMRVKKNENV